MDTAWRQVSKYILANLKIKPHRQCLMNSSYTSKEKNINIPDKARFGGAKNHWLLFCPSCDSDPSHTFLPFAMSTTPSLSTGPPAITTNHSIQSLTRIVLPHNLLIEPFIKRRKQDAPLLLPIPPPPHPLPSL